MKQTYAGIPKEFATIEKANIVLSTVPYDGTSTWQKGADKGPQAFLDASENMELYDIETDSEVYKQGVFMPDAITENSSPEAMTEAVYKLTKEYILKDKFVTTFGGEHSISIGAISAHNEVFQNLTVLQIDAHADAALLDDHRGQYSPISDNRFPPCLLAAQHTPRRAQIPLFLYRCRVLKNRPNLHKRLLE